MKNATKWMSVLLALALVLSLGTLTAFAAEEAMPDASAYVDAIENANIDPALYLDYSAAIDAGVYQWILSDDGSYYTLAAVNEEGEADTTVEAEINVGANNEEAVETNTSASGEASGRGSGGMSGGTVYEGVYMNANITNEAYQTMLIYVPAAYFTTDEDGNVTGIDHDAQVGGYTADTAPIVFANECGGWRSSSPRSCDTSYIEEGFIYVTAGARSRDAVDEDGVPSGKAPTQMVDLKSGVIELRANADVIPGDTDRIVSIGTSGGGEMSSAFGASGNMPEYYEYMYESGVLGVTKNEDGTYASAYPDNIYAAQCYCPIADIENADLAYAWWWVDLVEQGGTYGTFTEFDIRLQELEAEAFVDYINSLNLTDAEGNPLTLDDLRSGSYYDAVLGNISDALNAAVEAGMVDPATEYPDADCTLEERDAWKLLVQVRLAAQCTDERVNQVVPALFARFPNAEAMAKADPAARRTVAASNIVMAAIANARANGQEPNPSVSPTEQASAQTAEECALGMPPVETK